MCYYMGPKEMDAVKGVPVGGATPVGGLSVFASIGAPLDGGGAGVPGAEGNAATVAVNNETEANGFRAGTLPPRPAVVVAVPMDAAAVFAQEAQGAVAAVGSVVAALAAAEAVANALHDAGPGGASLASLLPRQVVFALMQAESWGAVGSRRLLFDAVGGAAANARCAPEFVRSWDASVSSDSDDAADPRTEYCVRPLMPSLAFQRLGPALGVGGSSNGNGNGNGNSGTARVIAMDQVGRLASTNGGAGGALKAYAHASGSGGGANDPVAAALIAAASGVDGIEVAAGSAPEVPASPADAFYLAGALNESATGGGGAAVLAGYDSDFLSNHFHSAADSAMNVAPNADPARGKDWTRTPADNNNAVDPIAVARIATVVARAVLSLANESAAGGTEPGRGAISAEQVESVYASNATVLSLLACLAGNFTRGGGARSPSSAATAYGECTIARELLSGQLYQRSGTFGGGGLTGQGPQLYTGAFVHYLQNRTMVAAEAGVSGSQGTYR